MNNKLNMWVLYSYNPLWDNPDCIGVIGIFPSEEVAKHALADEYIKESEMSDESRVDSRFYIDEAPFAGKTGKDE